MITDDLRTRAREAAETRFPGSFTSYSHTYSRDGFIKGALWHAAQQPSRDIDVDELARVIERASDAWWNNPSGDGPSVSEYRAAAVKAWLTGDEGDE